MTNYKNTVAGSSIAFVAGIFAFAFMLAPVVHAADLKLGGWFPESIDSYIPMDSGWYPESMDSYSPYDSGWYPESIDSYSPYYNDYYTPSYGGYGGGSYYGGSGFMGGGSYSAPGYTNVNTNVNENYCTNGSCNTSSSVNAPTTIVTNYPPQQTYQQPPVYTPPTYYPTQQPVYQQPIAYNRPAPYVSLAAVPYTGLELGVWGTAMYWGFLVLWCLVAAYLIAVKKIQNKIAAWFVGSAPSHTAHYVAPQAPVAFAAPAALHSTSSVQAKVQASGIDPFIQSQINRAK